ncbi:MAG TPA: SagB/ThcOx family dehydrogenase [Phycisphaerae bacterium]|nr:SagB/ThcOx family dehydrogenase [Phycisphaerae bacterium]HUS44427.1 SagB/ThcOx family dehydrogenase [Phycisphaerae bacterium]
MTLLHEYQEGTSYRRDVTPRKDPEWRRSVPPYKSYTEAGAETVALERPRRLPKADFWEVLRSRRSRRTFSAEPISQETLFLLLWAAQGITAGGRPAFRTAPSAGALYPVETYVCAARVEGVAPGVYHWELPEERLALVAAREDVAEVAAQACLDQDMVAHAPVTFVWTAVWGRSAQKYGDRALRYAYLDAGHLAENLHLAATALGLGACMVGAFLDDEMNDLVGVDGRAESVIYAACAGVPVAPATKR